jgi:hypothetical protein
LTSKRKKIDGILAAKVRYRDNLPLFPEEVIGKSRDVANMDPAADDFDRHR